MRIIINKNWEIKTDGLNWTLYKPGTKKMKNATYHATLQQALLECFQSRLLKETNSILINHLNKEEKEIQEAKFVKLIEKIKDEIISAAGGR